MNGVERIVYYADSIEQEAAHEIKDHQPPANWPTEGSLNLNQIELKYRPGLPSVLKGLTMNIKGGEKIGIVGRWVLLSSSIYVL